MVCQMQILLLKKSAVAHKNIHTQRIRADQHCISLQHNTKQSQEKQNKAGVVLHGMAWHEVLLLFRSILIRLHRLLLTFDGVQKLRIQQRISLRVSIVLNARRFIIIIQKIHCLFRFFREKIVPWKIKRYKLIKRRRMIISR